MSTFKRVLIDYLMCYNIQDCRAWVNSQPCGKVKKEQFLECSDIALMGSRDADWLPTTYETMQDYVDSLRRNYYVGLGI